MSKRLTWTAVADDLPVLTCNYSFGPGDANALAVPGDDGFVVVSPPCNAPESTYAELEKRGKVRALVASNAFHNMGIAPWKARFPDAKVYAPAQAVARVKKKSGVSDIEPLAEAAAVSGADLELIDMPHYKTGEVLVRLKHGAHVVWYVTDVIMNMPALPPKFPFKQIFKWTGSAPGLRPNGVASKFMIKDKSSLYRWLRAETDKLPPTVLVASHGNHVIGDAAARLREILPA
jgi:hypothetical protein